MCPTSQKVVALSQTTGIILFVVGILVSIMIHEWGHFWTARRFGMRADRYFLGFGPTVWSTVRGETEYGVKALPLGGFVRILGMSPGDERRGPITTEWADREVLARERRADAEASGGDLMTVPAVAAPSWQRLATALRDRGTPPVTADAIVATTRGADPATADEANGALSAAIAAHVPAPSEPDPASLHHRLVKGDEDRFFGDKPAWQRAIVLAAGSALHFTIAIVLLLGGLLLIAQPTGDVTSEVDLVQAGSPADEVGLQVGDVIVAVEGTRSDDFFVLRDEIREHPGEPVTIEVQRDDEVVTVVPTADAVEDPTTGEIVGVVGFAPREVTARMGVGDALHATFVGPASIPAMTGASLDALVDVFGPEGIGALFGQISGDEDRSVEGGISMVGGASVTGQGVATYGIMFLLSMLVSINVFIGVFNLLPLPPLDGGHLAVLGVEKGVNLVRRLTGRAPTFKVSHQAVAAVALPVLVLIGTVGLSLIWLDITNPIQLP